MRQARELLECRRCGRVAAFVKQKDRHAQGAKLAGEMAQPIDLLLHGVADKDEGVDHGAAGLADRVVEHPLDLGVATDTGDGLHDAMQIRGGGHPTARLAFGIAAIKGELDVEPTDAGDGFEHRALDMAGLIPGGPAAGSSVEGEDQPAAAAGGCRTGFEAF